MKRKCFIIFSLLILLLFAFSVQIFATNANVVSDDEINDIIASYETNYEYTSSDLFLFDSEIEMSEIVDGNVFAYGSSVSITGEIYGDLFVFANSLNIAENAMIYGNVFACANTITVSGIVSDMYVASSNFSLTENGGIARNLYLTSNTVSLGGQIKRDAYITTENLSIGNTLDDGENRSEEIIQGDLNYTSGTNFIISEDLVGGEINYTELKTDTSSKIWSVVSSIIMTLLFSFVIIMLALWLTPNFKDRACEIISKKGFFAFVIGIIVFLLAILIAFVLFIFTYGFGVGIAIALIALLILAYSISNTIFSIAIGKVIANKLNLNKNIVFVLFSLLIVLIIKLIGYIPYVGTPITFITAITGLGILCINAYKRKDLVKSAKEAK